MRRSATYVRHLAVALCVAIATTMVVAQDEPAPAQAPQVFRGTVDFVYVDVYPRRNGQLIDGLTPADFEVFEDGKLQKIETFELVRSQMGDGERADPRNADEAARWVGDPKRRVFVVYVDLYHITRSAAHAMRGPMMEFLARTIGPSDVVVVMTPETPVSGIVFAGTLNTLSAEVERYWEWGLDEPILVPRTPAESQLAACGNSIDGYQRLLRLHRQVVLFTSLESLMTRLSSMRDERTGIIFLSEGWTNGPGAMTMAPGRSGGRPLGDVQFGPFGAPSSDVAPVRLNPCSELVGRLMSVDFQDRFRQLLRRANAANVTFYPIDVGGLRTYAATASARGNGPSGSRDRADTLRELAENTNGIATADSNDLPRAFQRITDNLAGYYLLGYYTTNSQHDGKFRKIEVNVRQKDVQVTARRGYMAPTDGIPRGTEPRVTVAPVAPRVSDAIGQLSRLSPDAGMFGDGVASSQGLDIVAELASRQVEGGRWRDGADVRVELTAADGGKHIVTGRIEPGRRSVALHVPAASGGRGPWQAYIGIVGGGELAERITITVPVTTLLGDPRIFRGPPSVRQPLQPAAAPLFQPGERVRVEWPLLKPIDQRTVRVLDRRGQPLAREAALTESTSDTGAIVAADVNLTNLAEGDYLLDVVVGAGAETEQRLLPFRLAR